ncbi:MAG: sugar phosphate isomerase/epimerase [Rickettsiales bacterium]|nr:sugar phosphate isomerase/epimerase [Rickettsiales bacterium]
MIGCCANLGNQTLLKNAGFDFIEIKASELYNSCEEIIMNIYAINNLLPRTLNLFSNLGEITKETEKVFESSKKANIKVITFGSGTCRRVDFNNNAWESVWRKYLLYLNNSANKYKIKTTIEPLAKEETNLVNTLEEALFYVKKGYCPISVAIRTKSPSIAHQIIIGGCSGAFLQLY